MKQTRPPIVRGLVNICLGQKSKDLRGGVENLRCPDAKPLGINPERLVVEPRVPNDPHGRPGVEGEWKDNLEF